MRLPSCGCVALLAFAIQPIVGSQLWAEDPTIEMLIAGTPVLGPHNDRLTSFRLECEVMTWFEVPVIAKLVWSRPDRFGMIVTAGEERTPFWFLSEKESMDFDVTSGTVLLGKDGRPGFVVRSDDEKITLNFSITGDAKTEVAVDLPSFLTDATRNGQLRQDPDGDWRLTSVSKSGKTKVIGVFQNCKGFPIRRLEMRSVVNDSLALAIREISTNTGADTTWPDFPAPDSFPKGLKVARIGDLKGETHADGIGVVARGLRAMWAQGALRNPKWRNVPFLYNIDWVNAQKTNDDFGPRLRTLLNVGWAEPAHAPEPAAGSVSNGDSLPPAR